MGHKKYPLDLIRTKVAAAGSNDVEMDPVGGGLLYCIQRIIVENETSTTDDVRIIKAGVGAEIPVAEKDDPGKATLFVVDEPFYLHEGQYLLARFTACSADDHLAMYLLGWFAEV